MANPISWNEQSGVSIDFGIIPSIPNESTTPVANVSSGNGSGSVSSSSKSNGALEQLYELSKSNPEYLETYLQLLAERENEASARSWYEKMSNSSYQRAYKDLQAAGLNPYLALQSLGGAGSGSVQAAGSWSTSPFANAETKRSNQMQEGTNIAKLGVSLGTAIISILAMLAVAL